MSNPKERLVDFKVSAEQPSKLVARKIVENLSKNLEPLADGFATILDGYDDQDYTPNLVQIEGWARREAKAMNEAFASLHRDNADASGSIDLEAIFSQIGKNDGRKSMDELVEILATNFSWMDNAFFQGGSPLDAHWHGVHANSALLQVAKSTSKIIDTLYNLVQWAIACRVDGAIQVVQGFEEDPDIFIRSVEEKQLEIKAALNDISEATDFAIKIGFLYRDAWWLDQHSDAALKGYLAKQTAKKAGTGGGKASSSARAKRIDAFLKAHALMMSQNPILADDAPEERAIRAMKLARKDNPGLFENINSNKTAIEYWEYIRFDAKLWRKYTENTLYFKSL